MCSTIVEGFKCKFTTSLTDVLPCIMLLARASRSVYVSSFNSVNQRKFSVVGGLELEAGTSSRRFLTIGKDGVITGDYFHGLWKTVLTIYR